MRADGQHARASARPFPSVIAQRTRRITPVTCVGSAVKALFAGSSGPQVLVKVERPQRSEDERHPLCQPLGRTFLFGRDSGVGGGAVFGRLVGCSIEPAAVDNAYPGAGEDSDRVGVVVAALDGATVDAGGQGLACRELSANVTMALRKRLLHAQRNPTERCLPDCFVTGLTPARAATDSALS